MPSGLREFRRYRRALTAALEDLKPDAVWVHGWGNSFPLAALREYCEKCLALFGRLYCANCGSFAEAIPDRNRPLAVVCRCRTVSYVNPALIAGQPGVAHSR